MSIFTEISKEKWLYWGDCFFMIFDNYPTSLGHILIISKREVPDFFSLNKKELRELTQMIKHAKQLIDMLYSPDGYNIGMNCGEVAGQTVMHFHCHVIPRYNGDMENPKGGIRHCIEGKGYY